MRKRLEVSQKLSIVTSLKNLTLPDITALSGRLAECYNSGVNLEWVVQSNGSSAEAVQRISQLQFARLNCEEDEGIYEAWNLALTRVSGELVTFLGCDDIPSVDWLRFASSQMLVGRQAVTCDVALVYDAKLLGLRSNPRSGIIRLGAHSYSHPGIVFSFSIFEGQRFPERYKVIGDGVFYCNAAPLEIKSCFSRVGVNMGLGGLSNSARGARVRFIEIVSAVLIRDIPRRPAELWQAFASFPAYVASFLPFGFERLQALRWKFTKGGSSFW